MIIKKVFIKWGDPMPEDSVEVLKVKESTRQYTNDAGGQAGHLGVEIIYLAQHGRGRS